MKTQIRKSQRRTIQHCFGDTVTGEARTSVDAFRDTFGRHRITKEPAYHLTDRGFEPTPGQHHLVRDSDGVVVSPSTVGDRYSIIQPGTLIDTMAPLVHEGVATFDRSWQMAGGTLEAIQLQLGTEARMLRGDPSTFKHYVLAVANHGMGSAFICSSSIRCACDNMWHVALSGGETIRVQHTGDADGRYRFAFQSLETIRGWLREHLPVLEVFAETTVHVPDTVEEILALNDKPEEEWSSRARNKRAAIIHAAFHSPGVSGAGTALDVLNATTYYNSHELGTASNEKAAQSALMGGRRNLEARTMKVLAKTLEGHTVTL